MTHLLLNTNYQRACYPSQVWDSYWDIDDPETNLKGWPRVMWRIHQAGVDPYAVCIENCRNQGISPWASMRMNDTHYLQDPHKANRFWREHPEYRTAPTAGFNFAISAVRQHHLALVEEILDRYDVDGLELTVRIFLRRAGRDSAGPVDIDRLVIAAGDFKRARGKRGPVVDVDDEDVEQL